MAHVVLFPFMSKGHTIPLIHLAHLLLRRGLKISIFTTHANSPFIRQSLGAAAAMATVIDLPFPKDAPHLPPGVESTDQLPSMSFILPFFHATKLLQPDFEQALHSLPQAADCVISDGFLAWSRLSTSKLGVRWLAFYGMNTCAMVISRALMIEKPHAGVADDDEPFSIPSFPWIKLTKHDLDPPFKDPEPKGPYWDFVVEAGSLLSEGDGFIINSFYEIESVYVDYWNKECKPKAWCVGPLCLAAPRPEPPPKTRWVEWLDQKLAAQRPVLYVAFGTQAEISAPQLEEIAVGLERSGVDFLWVLRPKEAKLGDGFEERCGERGLVVREWVDQRAALEHGAVRGFMSHCGWNSVVESISAAVPILAWPMMAEQPINEKLVVEELRIGVRIGKCRHRVEAEDVEEKVRELMAGDKGKEVEEKMRAVGEAARKAMEEGGSSWNSMETLLSEMSLSGPFN